MIRIKIIGTFLVQLHLAHMSAHKTSLHETNPTQATLLFRTEMTLLGEPTGSDSAPTPLRGEVNKRWIPLMKEICTCVSPWIDKHWTCSFMFHVVWNQRNWTSSYDFATNCLHILLIKSSRGMLPTRGLPSRDMQLRPFHLTKSRVMDILSKSWTSQTPQKLSKHHLDQILVIHPSPWQFFLNTIASQNPESPGTEVQAASLARQSQASRQPSWSFRQAASDGTGQRSLVAEEVVVCFEDPPKKGKHQKNTHTE